jgi:hypothetical protein
MSNNQNNIAQISAAEFYEKYVAGRPLTYTEKHWFNVVSECEKQAKSLCITTRRTHPEHNVKAVAESILLNNLINGKSVILLNSGKYADSVIQALIKISPHKINQVKIGDSIKLSIV